MSFDGENPDSLPPQPVDSMDDSADEDMDDPIDEDTSADKEVPMLSTFGTWYRSKRAREDSICGDFDQDASQKALAKMIIIDGLPFKFVENVGFRQSMPVLQPRFVIPPWNTVARDCMDLYILEKNKLRELFKKHQGSVSLTVSIWTSKQNTNYMCLTAHFVDDDWKLHRKIINFCPIPDDNDGETIGKMVEKCLLHWRINKVFTVTVDNARSDDLWIEYLDRKFKSWGTSFLEVEFLQMRCGAHILGLVVKDGFQEIHESIIRIRAAVRYVRSSSSRIIRFRECLEHQRLSTTAGLCLDMEARWSTTYLMLESALKSRPGFDMLLFEDDEYVEDLTENGLGPPRDDDWTCVQSFLPILKFFYDTTLKISGSRYVTGNDYMEAFGAWWYIEQMVSCDESDESQRSMAKRMQKIFEKYWHSDVNVITYLACVLDPRYRLDFVSWMIRDSYNDNDKAEEVIGKLKSVLEKLFKYYESISSNDAESSGSQIGSRVRYDAYGKPIIDDTCMRVAFREYLKSREKGRKNELESYLSDVCETVRDESFDVLYWWKVTGAKYPVLSRMAKDVLAIPVSTVSSEHAFNTDDRVLDQFRSSLTPQLVEALVCTQDWIREDYETVTIEKTLEDLEKMEEDIQPKMTAGGSSSSFEKGYSTE